MASIQQHVCRVTSAVYRLPRLVQNYSHRHGGSIRLGDYCYAGENTHIWSANSVTIGNRVLISHGVNIRDANAHSLSAATLKDQVRARAAEKILPLLNAVDRALIRTRMLPVLIRK
jgi:acetyltransferase-like isoleucine patch superfamily enzyme